MSDSQSVSSSVPKLGGARISDLIALIYLAIATIVVVQLVQRVHSHPYILAFVKFLLLASFGECLRGRLAGQAWIPSKFPQRAVIWGFFGIWIAISFQITDAGVRWFIDSLHQPRVLSAFAISAWMNIFSGYGFFMMLTHYISDRILADGWHSPSQILRHATFGPWSKIVMLTLVFFWTPAHTITFLLPSMWRIVFAAYLGIALGALLSLAAASARKSIERERLSKL